MIVTSGLSEESEDCVANGESEANTLLENVLKFVTDGVNVVISALPVGDDETVDLKEVVEKIVNVLIDDRVGDGDE